MADAPVLVEVADGVAEVVLNRPGQANSFDSSTVQALLDAASRCEADPAVRAVLIRGCGPHFCAGGDIRVFAQELDAGTLRAFSRGVAAQLHLAVARLHRLDAPVVVAVHGPAAGAGLSLVCAADIAIAGPGARFRAGYPGIGTTMDGGLSYFLPRLVGMRTALRLALTNETLDSAQALAAGLVTDLVDDPEQLLPQARALTRRLAAGPTRAYGDIKRLLYGGWTQGLETALELEARSMYAAFGTHDAQEGIAAFTAKRTPRFSGA